MVHWDRKAARRKIILQIGVLLLLLLVIAFAYERRTVGTHENALGLQILSRETLPLKEISGMTKFKENGQEKIALIGDSKAEVYWLDEGVGQSFKDQMVKRFSLCQTDAFDECDKMIKKITKNWEGVAADGANNFFFLQEHTQSLVVMDRQLDSFLHVLHFNFSEAFDAAVAKGARKVRKNALGEGLVLLKNGHVLIAKENFPVALVEFGPDGDDPLGFGPEALLPEGEAFSFKGEDFHQQLVPLHSWTLATHGKCDISELALDKNQQLLAMSEDCLTIYRYPELKVGVDPEPSEVFLLPGEIQSPEALAVLGDEWLVGSDVANKKQFNLYRLKAQHGVK